MLGYVRVQLNNMRACFIIFIWPETKHLSLDRVSNTERKQVRVRVWEQEREWENENDRLPVPALRRASHSRKWGNNTKSSYDCVKVQNKNNFL